MCGRKARPESSDMRILTLHLHDEKFQMGGADQGVLDLNSALAASFGHEVRVLSNAGPFARAAAARNLPWAEIPHSKAALLKIIKIINAEIGSFKPDVLHSHHRYTTFLLDLFFKKKGIPILHTQRIQASDKIILFRYGHFMTTVSESLRRHMMSWYRVPENRVRAIVNAVPLKKPDARILEDLKREYPRRPGQVFMLCAGRFHEQKGHEYLISAAALLEPSVRQRIKIFLAGDGPLEEELKQSIAAKSLQENFVFTGYLKGLSEYLQFCDLLVLPSLWEGLPRVILEAFNQGRPAIATDIPGTAEVLEDRKNGLVVKARSAEDLARAMREVLEHPETLAGMQAGALASSKKYSFEAMVRNYHELYQELQKEFREH